MTFVYFILDPTRNAIKIGYSYNPRKRLRQLSTKRELRLLGTFKGARDQERELHQRFSSDALGGEWFTATPSLLSLAATHAHNLSALAPPSVVEITLADRKRLRIISARTGLTIRALVEKALTAFLAKGRKKAA